MSDPVHAVVGLFETPRALLEAIARLRPRGLGRLEAYTPYPVHGIDQALGLRRSPLPGMVLVMGIVGTVTAFAFQYWISAVDYPLITGGKPATSWQAFVPIMFEVMVLFATFTAGLGMLLLLNRLPELDHPLLGSSSMSAITRDRLALAVESEGDGLDVAAAQRALTEAGAVAVEVVARPPGPYTVSIAAAAVAALVAGVAVVAAGLGTWVAVKAFPALPPMVHMLEQPRLSAQGGSGFFEDGRAARLPVPGTVARGRLPHPFTRQEEASVLGNPLARTGPVLALGRRVYGERCLVCHGSLGDGKALLSAAYGAKPANLHTAAARALPDGQIYHVIVAGKNSMPPYVRELSQDERWAAVHYVRALQRAQNAEARDF
ncbi:MAG: DUF3341 domain-containing protein [Candidatus Riflebacteria bacterium]|nr:DUF3341 domain-containing protein [Candidatus Riflebacteria bacterium]